MGNPTLMLRMSFTVPILRYYNISLYYLLTSIVVVHSIVYSSIVRANIIVISPYNINCSIYFIYTVLIFVLHIRVYSIHY